MRLCQVGCGEHGEAHGPSQAAARESVATSSSPAADLDAARAEASADFGYGRAFTDAAAMLGTPRAARRWWPAPANGGRRVDGPRSVLPAPLLKVPGKTVPEVDRLIAAAEKGAHRPARSRSTGASPRSSGSCAAGWTAGGTAAARPLRDDASRAARPGRRPWARRRAVSRRLRLHGGPLSRPGVAGSRAGVANILVDAVMASARPHTSRLRRGWSAPTRTAGIPSSSTSRCGVGSTRPGPGTTPGAGPPPRSAATRRGTARRCWSWAALPRDGRLSRRARGGRAPSPASARRASPEIAERVRHPAAEYRA